MSKELVIIVAIVFSVSMILLLYKLYNNLFLTTNDELNSTTNNFNNMHHKSDFEKVLSYHSMDN